MKCICHGIKFSLTLLAVFWLIAGNAVASNSQSIQTIASVSFTTVDSVDFLGTVIGIPLISAEVNGHSAQLVFDTGTSYNFVTDDFAKRIGLIDDKSSNVIVDATGSEIDAKTYDLVPIEVGSYTIKSNILSARDENFSASVGTNSDGILGKVAIANAAALISPTLKTVTFYIPGNLTRQQLKKIGMDNAVALPLKLTKNNMLCISVTLNNKQRSVSEDLTIDTGSERSIVSEGAFKTLKGEVISKGSFTSRLRKGSITYFTIDQALLGALSVNKLLVGCTESKSLYISPTLGRDVLSQYQVLIDAPAMTMYLLPATVPIPPQKDGTMLPLDTSQTDTTKEQPK